MWSTGPPHIASGNVNQASYWRKQLDSSSKSQTELLYDPAIPFQRICPPIREIHKQKLKQVLIHQCLLQHYSQSSKGINNPCPLTDD